MQRLLGMAQEKLGPAPTRFAFLALGSEGREEQTLLTDQDNALLYEDPPAEKAEETAQYFLNMGTLVSDWLAQVGYAYCEGGVMAKNPRWNLSQSKWREQFAYWIHNADPQELLELNMLFDFRPVTGEKQFAHDLRSWVFEQMEDYPLFYVHFAQNALLYKPPLSLLGNIQATASEDGRKAVSLKEALMPIVNFARLYALKHHIDSTNTLDRLAELQERGILGRESYEQIVPDYETLMRIRLQQAGERDRGEPQAQQPHPAAGTHLGGGDEAEAPLLGDRGPAQEDQLRLPGRYLRVLDHEAAGPGEVLTRPGGLHGSLTGGPPHGGPPALRYRQQRSSAGACRQRSPTCQRRQTAPRSGAKRKTRTKMPLATSTMAPPVAMSR